MGWRRPGLPCVAEGRWCNWARHLGCRAGGRLWSEKCLHMDMGVVVGRLWALVGRGRGLRGL